MDLYGELAWRGMVYDTTEGLQEVLAARARDGLRRLRSDRRQPSRRIAAAGAWRWRACSDAATARSRWSAAAPASSAIPAARRSSARLLSSEKVETNVARHPVAAGAVPRLRPGPPLGAAGQQRRVARRAERPGVHARRRQVLHRQLHAGQGIGEAPGRERGRHLLHRVQLLCCCRPTTSSCSTIATAAAADGRQRPVGQHHRRSGSDSQDARRARRTAW